MTDTDDDIPTWGHANHVNYSMMADELKAIRELSDDDEVKDRLEWLERDVQALADATDPENLPDYPETWIELGEAEPPKPPGILDSLKSLFR